jgi:hypothetical protein
MIRKTADECTVVPAAIRLYGRIPSDPEQLMVD